MNMVGRIGAGTLAWLDRIRHVASVAAASAACSLRPGAWTGAMNQVLVRQILFTAIEAVPFVGAVALAVGLVVVAQAQVWLDRIGQTGLLGPLLVFVIIREVGPLLTNFIVIGRSGTAIAAELAAMKVAGEVHTLDAQGLDPFTYLVVPRVAGVMISVLGLTVLFVVGSLISGYLAAGLLNEGFVDASAFAEQVLGAVKPVDAVNVVAKTLLPGWLTGTICCVEGLAAEGQITEVPKAASRGVIRSVEALFFTSAVVSVLTYL